MNPEKLLQVIRSQHVSEKATLMGERNQYTFSVRTDSTKQDIAKAIELYFNVKVVDVRTLVVKGKAKRFKQQLGRRKDWKKAYVTLAEGSEIDFSKVE